MSKAMSLKAKIRNIAKQKNIPAQVILQNYMFERLLVRLPASEYQCFGASAAFITEAEILMKPARIRRYLIS